MKRIFSVQPNSTPIDVALLLLRVGVAALMLTHGVPKLLTLFSGEPVQFVTILGLTAEASLSLTVFAEVFCSVLLLTGFATRLATVPLIITMLVAIFSVHAEDPFGRKELAVFYLIIYTALLIAGSGKFSLDYLLQQKIQNMRSSKLVYS